MSKCHKWVRSLQVFDLSLWVRKSCVQEDLCSFSAAFCPIFYFNYVLFFPLILFVLTFPYYSIFFFVFFEVSSKPSCLTCLPVPEMSA